MSRGLWKVGRRLGDRDNFGFYDTSDRIEFDPPEGFPSFKGDHLVEDLKIEFRHEAGSVVGGRIEIELDGSSTLESPNRALHFGLLSVTIGGLVLKPADKIVEHDVYLAEQRESSQYWTSTTKFPLSAKLASQVFDTVNAGGTLSLVALVPNDGDVPVSINRIEIDLSALKGFHDGFGDLEKTMVKALEAQECKIAYSGAVGCYLTTICCQVIGLPDDCFELTVLRSFRDRFMAREPGGRSDLIEYRRIGPVIADAIARSPRRHAIARSAYLRYILPSVLMVLVRRPAWAWAHYRRGVTYLVAQPEIDKRLRECLS